MANPRQHWAQTFRKRFAVRITKLQIEGLLHSGALQMTLFAEKVCEAVDGNIRYVLRRNPQRAEDMARSRRNKQASVAKSIEKIHERLAEDFRLKVDAGLRRIKGRIEQQDAGGWLEVNVDGTQLKLECSSSPGCTTPSGSSERSGARGLPAPA